MRADECYETAEGPLKQGDIVIAPVARVCSEGFFVPDRWDRLDQTEHTVDYSDADESSIYVASGRSLVMVTSHDCHHDKEWNQERRRLIQSGVGSDEASVIAEANEYLDRAFQASPLVPLEDFDAGQHGNLRAGHVVGCYPLPQPVDGAFPESVVDLTYRCTIDRKAIEQRRWGLSIPARARLRLAIANFDSFRTLELAEQIETAIGKTIESVRVGSAGPLTVELALDDGTTLQLVQSPVEPDPGGRLRI
ncbi:MAG: hypothetical protein F4117_13810 [Acidimicrobiales bacterium]|nr:hypothetical protein [Acidimicrobiaceae bacterium]MYB80344.1 hypothetical protein [Acidimicrobiales bacterium]MCY3609431.1 hypothetical protein [Acidimicrobiaceae bacterium]MDE0676711.1 hypothetical protein [Acidimicrobiaceae bacterium]MYI13624.1 hypothetical protein [Acidimicrobiales bacterium]